LQVQSAKETLPGLLDPASSGKESDGKTQEDFDLWGCLDDLVREAAATKLQAAARGRIARGRKKD